MYTVKYVSRGHVRYFKTEHLDAAKLLAIILKQYEPNAEVEVWE